MATNKDFEKRISNLEENSEKILEIVTELKVGVCGSEQIGVEGLIKQSRRHEKFIEHCEKLDLLAEVARHKKYISRDKKMKYTVYGAFTAITFVLTWLTKFWDKIKNSIN